MLTFRNNVVSSLLFVVMKINKSTQPQKCSDGLECSKRSGGNLHMRCWTAADIAEQEGGENMGVPPPTPPSVTFPPFPPVPMPPTFPVPVPGPLPPTFPANVIDPNNCAGEGDRAQQCGASANRPPMCCEGFVCTPGNAKVSHRVSPSLLWRNQSCE